MKRGSGAWPGWTAFRCLSATPGEGSHSAGCLFASCGFALALLSPPQGPAKWTDEKSGGARALDWELDLEYNPNVLARACLFSGPQLLHVKYGGWADASVRQA